MSDLVPHPIAELLPLMSDLEYAALYRDIAEQGLVDPIVLFQGKILDGRNRYRACERLGIAIRTTEFNGTSREAANLVLSHTCRRNLNKGQLACVALRFTDKLGMTGAAERLGVGRRYIFYAQVVARSNRKHFDQVIAGRLSLHRAHSQIVRCAASTSPTRVFRLIASPESPVEVYLNGTLVFTRGGATQKGAI